VILQEQLDFRVVQTPKPGLAELEFRVVESTNPKPVWQSLAVQPPPGSSFCFAV
jgi:hypothetical protein